MLYNLQFNHNQNTHGRYTRGNEKEIKNVSIKIKNIKNVIGEEKIKI